MLLLHTIVNLVDMEADMNNKNSKALYLLIVILTITFNNVHAQENMINRRKNEIGMCRAVLFVASTVTLMTRNEDIRSSSSFRKKFLELYALGFRLEEYLDKKFGENSQQIDKYRVKVEYEWKKDNKYLVSNVEKCANWALDLPVSKLEKKELSVLCQNLNLC